MRQRGGRRSQCLCGSRGRGGRRLWCGGRAGHAGGDLGRRGGRFDGNRKGWSALGVRRQNGSQRDRLGCEGRTGRGRGLLATGYQQHRGKEQQDAVSEAFGQVAPPGPRCGPTARFYYKFRWKAIGRHTVVLTAGVVGEFHICRSNLRGRLVRVRPTLVGARKPCYHGDGEAADREMGVSRRCEMAIEVQELVRSGIYPNTDVALQEALRVLWQARPAIRIDVAVHHYRTDRLSVARSAALAGVSFDQMKEILAVRARTCALDPRPGTQRALPRDG